MVMKNILILVLVTSPSLANLPPKCLYEQYSLESLAVGRVTCKCRGREDIQGQYQPVYEGESQQFYSKPSQSDEASYSGNLNFLKEHLGQVSNNNPNIEVIIKECHILKLHLNFNILHNYNVILNIQNSNNTQISSVTLRDPGVSSRDNKQRLSFRNISGRISMTGQVRRTGLASSRSGEELVVKVENAGDLFLENLLVDPPLKVTAKHLSSATVSNSSLSHLPWPGLYLFNVTRVLITGNQLRPLTPRSVLFLADVPHINISHNVFPNLSLAVNVEEFQQMTIRCNRLDLYKDPGPGCPVGPQPIMILNNPGPTILSVLEPGSQVEEEDEENKEEVEEEVGRELSASDIYGLVWIVVAAVLLVLIVLSVACCCCARIRNNKEHGREEKEENRYHEVEEGEIYNQVEQGLITIKEDEDEHFSKPDGSRSSPCILSPPFITVNEVKSSPGKGGVILGSLTLGPSFPVKDSSERNKVSNKLKQETFQQLVKKPTKL